jgi:hypothetical protein
VKRAASRAGYSGTPLPAKLGLVDGARLFVVEPPRNFDRLLAGAPSAVRLGRLAEFDIALAFITREAMLAETLTRLLPRLAERGMIWICWPKRASGVATDVTEDTVRKHALPTGLVDVKVCAIDDTWSGLKLLRRRARRGPR